MAEWPRPPRGNASGSLRVAPLDLNARVVETRAAADVRQRVGREGRRGGPAVGIVTPEALGQEGDSWPQLDVPPRATEDLSQRIRDRHSISVGNAAVPRVLG